MIRRYMLTENRLAETEDNAAPVIVCIAPVEAEKKWLIEENKIDEHTLNSALDPDELARLELEPEHIAMIFKRPKNYSSEDDFLFKVESTGLFLFRDRLVVVLREEYPIFEGRTFQKLASLHDLLLKILYRAIFHFMNHLRVINEISGELERHISRSMENKYLLNMFTLEKSLVYYLNAINSNAKVMDRLKANAAKVGFLPESLEMLDDVLIENSQCYEHASTYSTVLSSLMDARASIVSNNLNVLMKTLTLITIGIMLPTLVVSIFSMNVRIPLAQHAYAFWVILGLAGLSASLLVLVWRYRRW